MVAPQAVIDTPAASLTWKVGDQINFCGHGSDPDEGALPDSRLSVVARPPSLHDPDQLPLPFICRAQPGVASGSFVTPDHDYPSHLELTLTVTDSAGASDSKTIKLDPRTVALSFRSSPAGLQAGGRRRPAGRPPSPAR